MDTSLKTTPSQASYHCKTTGTQASALSAHQMFGTPASLHIRGSWNEGSKATLYRINNTLYKLGETSGHSPDFVELILVRLEEKFHGKECVFDYEKRNRKLVIWGPCWVKHDLKIWLPALIRV